MKTLKEILSFTKIKEQNLSKKVRGYKLISPAFLLLMLTSMIFLESCVVVAGRRHRRHPPREVIVVEHR